MSDQAAMVRVCQVAGKTYINRDDLVDLLQEDIIIYQNILIKSLREKDGKDKRIQGGIDALVYLKQRIAGE